MGRPRLTLLCGVILAATAFVTPAFAIDPADPLASESTTLAPVPVVTRSGPSWAAPQIATVVAAGLMGPDVTSFRPDDALTRGELHDAIVALGKPHRAPTDPNRVVTMRELDAQLVAAAGLLPSARQIRLAAQAGGLVPTDMLGTETVARLLGLRVNHPVGQEDLERSPKQPASRAEAAYSLAKLSLLDPTRIDAVRQVVATFVRPDVDGVAAARADAGAPLRRLPVRVRRDVGKAARRSGARALPATSWRCPAASTAPASSGGSSSCSPTTAHRPSPTSSRAGRRTR